MFNEILTSISEELEEVYQKIEHELLIKDGYIGSFAHLKYSFIDSAIRPALVILSARMFSKVNEKTIALAAVCQFIYMASQVHLDIPEENIEPPPGKEPDPRDGSQYPVLVGDYLYGKFFTTLCDYDIVRFLRPLSDIICHINEGGLLRAKNPNVEVNSTELNKNIISKETAELFASCCRLGAELSNAEPGECLCLHQFGKNFGMAYGLLEKGVPLENVIHYLNQALKELDLLNKSHAHGILEELVNLFLRRKVAVCRMVV